MDNTYVFVPSERSAASVEEFLAACSDEGAVAAEHLASGYFGPWLRDQGRPDLADLADDIRGSLREAGPTAMLERFLKEARRAKTGRTGSPARAGATRRTAPTDPSAAAVAAPKRTGSSARRRATGSGNAATRDGSGTSRASATKGATRKTA